MFNDHRCEKAALAFMRSTGKCVEENSKMAADMRGVQLEVPEAGKYKYTNALGRPYHTKSNKDIKSITFPISRFEKYMHTINFLPRVNEKQAIEAAEKYLSEPLTEEWYSKVQDDTFYEFPWESAKDTYKNRGETLTDLRFIEIIEIKDGKMKLILGS